MSRKFYAVAVGRSPGIYESWPECQSQVKGFPKAVFKSFKSREDAQSFVDAAVGAKNGSDSRDNNKNKNKHNDDDDAATATRPPKRPRVNPYAARSSSPSGPPPPANLRRVKIHIMFDGGSRGNPGLAGAGAVVSIASQIPSTTKSSTTGTTAPVQSTPVEPKETVVTSEETSVRETKTSRITTTVRTTTTTIVEPKCPAPPPAVGTASTGPVVWDTPQMWYVRHCLEQRATNNVAEYQGLISGMEQAIRHLQEVSKGEVVAIERLLIQGDSQLILKQLLGEYECRNKGLRPYYDRSKKVLQQLEALSRYGPPAKAILEHVPRAENSKADALANQAMDAKRSWISDELLELG